MCLLVTSSLVWAQETLPTPEPIATPTPTPAAEAPAVAAVQATVPGLYEVVLANDKVTNLSEYQKTLVQKKYRVLEAYEADGQAHLILYVRNHAELGHLQYYLNQRLSPMSLPLHSGQAADANYTRLQNAAQNPCIMQVKFDISAATNTMVREGFDDFSTRALSSELSLYAITDLDGNSEQLKRYQNGRYALPFYSGSIYYRVNSQEDSYRLQKLRTSPVVTDIVLHELPQRNQQPQRGRGQQSQAAGPNVPQSPYGNPNQNQDYPYPGRYRNEYPNYIQQRYR